MKYAVTAVLIAFHIVSKKVFIPFHMEVKKLLIGHFSARYDDEQVLLDEARAVFPNTQLAKETLCISV